MVGLHDNKYNLHIKMYLRVLKLVNFPKVKVILQVIENSKFSPSFWGQKSFFYVSEISVKNLITYHGLS